MSSYSDLIETAKTLKLDKFVHHDLSLNCFDSGTILEYKDGGGVGSDTATGSSSEDSVDGKLVIDEHDDDEQIGSRGTSYAAATTTTVATVSPFSHTLLIEDVPVDNVAVERRPRIVFDSERQIMKVEEETGDDDDEADGICSLRPAAAGHLERPPTLLMPPLIPRPFPPPPPSARLPPAAGKELTAHSPPFSKSAHFHYSHHFL